MNLNDTKNRFERALRLLLSKDEYLLEKNISERSISHRLALYLTGLFRLFDVDCEYNGDIENESLRKSLDISRDIMIDLAVRSIGDNDTYNIFPDIIIHKRGSNEKNHLIIEIKKNNTSPKQREYDLIKLKAFTSQYHYKLGIYLELRTGLIPGISKIQYFQNGDEKLKEELEDF